jgi:cystathionine gamma-synthase
METELGTLRLGRKQRLLHCEGLNGLGGMLSIQVKGGAEGALNVAKRCNVVTRATSLGGVESLIEHRHSIEGKNSPVPKDWLRLSIGIQSVDDLIADLEQALE